MLVQLKKSVLNVKRNWLADWMYQPINAHKTTPTRVLPFSRRIHASRCQANSVLSILEVRVPVSSQCQRAFLFQTWQRCAQTFTSQQPLSKNVVQIPNTTSTRYKELANLSILKVSTVLFVQNGSKWDALLGHRIKLFRLKKKKPMNYQGIKTKAIEISRH